VIRTSLGIVGLLTLAGWGAVAGCGQAFTLATASDASSDGETTGDATRDAPADVGGDAPRDAGVDVMLDALADSRSDAPLGKDSAHDAPSGDTEVIDTGVVDTGVPWSPVCPVTRPAAGTPCMSDGAECEYGLLEYDVSCDPVMKCAGGTWSKDVAYADFGCDDLLNSPMCPLTYEGAAGLGTTGKKCSDKGLRCEYSTKGVCICSPPVNTPVVLVDAGLSWSCNPGLDCPMPRPRLGASCSTTLSCTYQSCEFGETCLDGYWHGQLLSCPL